MSETLNVHREAGLGHLRAGNTDAALTELQAAIAQHPEDGKAFGLLGVCHAKRGDFAQSIDAMQQAARLQPNDAAAHFNLALALSKAERPDEARPAAEAALALNPAHPGARSLMSQLGPSDTGAGLGISNPFGMPPMGAAAGAAPPSPFGPPAAAAVPPSFGAAPSGEVGMGMGFGGPLGGDHGNEPTIGGAPGPFGMGAPGAAPAAPPSPYGPATSPSSPTIVHGPQGMSYTPPTPASLPRQESPGAGLRFGRGLLWGAIWGQWWTLWTIIWMVVWQSGKHEMGFMALEGLIYLFGYAFFGAVLGAVIAVINADISTGAVVGVVIGLIACGIEAYLAGSASLMVNVFFYFFTGRFIGASVAKAVQQPIIKLPAA
ncbi:MAG: tetratricopeptide repeat protein [Armatimonadota bacterium]|nr:tetratricopeptide repeat protein [Armatimonadota bacterium]